MTRWVRFLLTVLRSISRPRLRVDQESILDLRVWPTDADLSLMNHAGYLTVMEQGRVDLMLRTGVLRFLLRRHLSAVLTSITVQFRKPLRRFQKVQLRTRVACWDDQWIYVEHRIDRGGEFVASGLAKNAILGPGGRLRPAEMLSLFGLPVAAPPVPPMVQTLQEGERLMNERIQQWPALEWSLGT
jgi:acyl-CoA thioesterase FadM